MQTRKKSISLHALGVIPPHRSVSSSSTPTQHDSHPAKRLKRSHTLSASPTTPADPSLSLSTSPPVRQKQQPAHTPPPSPGDHPLGKLDKRDINDDVVVAVLTQLEATGNRPHQIKELANALASLKSVENSSNPVAIISSRLTNYLKRPWTALAPCPLAKEQAEAHPRRVYYYLSTCRHQPIPETVEIPAGNMRVISPSLSSGPDEEVPEPEPERKRDAMSPSPEVDLSPQDLDYGYLQSISNISFSQDATSYSSTPYTSIRRVASPPLEHDEREFTHTASVMQARKASEQAGTPSAHASASHSPEPSGVLPSMADADSPEAMVEDNAEESDEAIAQRNHEAAEALFGHHQNYHSGHLSVQTAHEFSSPMLRPSTSSLMGKDVYHGLVPARKPADEVNVMDSYGAWGDLKSPEAVGLSELDDLLGGF